MNSRKFKATIWKVADCLLNSDGTVVIFLTGQRGDRARTQPHTRWLERYKPGIPEKTIMV